MKWMFLPLKRYVDFDGRSPRIEYWLFHLFMWGVIFALAGTAFAMSDGFASEFGQPSVDYGESNPLMGVPIVIAVLFYLALWLPALAVTVRRLHDRNMSGWFVLINFIPVVAYVGGLIIFILMLLPGTDGENTYGENPLDEDGNHPDQLEQIFT